MKNLKLSGNNKLFVFTVKENVIKKKLCVYTPKMVASEERKGQLSLELLRRSLGCAPYKKNHNHKRTENNKTELIIV